MSCSPTSESSGGRPLLPTARKPEPPGPSLATLSVQVASFLDMHWRQDTGWASGPGGQSEGGRQGLLGRGALASSDPWAPEFRSEEWTGGRGTTGVSAGAPGPQPF